MVFCMNCGQQLPDGAKFCTSCGAAVGTASSESSSKRQTVYEGKAHICPRCHEIIPAFAVECPSCGCEFREVNPSEAVKEFNSQFNQAKTEAEQSSVIRTFSIPKSKEDVWEFLLLAGSNIDRGNPQSPTFSAWEAKLEEIYTKAKIAFAGDSKLQDVEAIYEKARKNVGRAKAKQVTKTTANGLGRFLKALSSILIASPGLFLIVVGSMLPIYDNTGVVLIWLGGAVSVIIAIYCGRKREPPIAIGSAVVMIGLALMFKSYDNRRIILVILGAAVLIAFAINLAKSSKTKQ